MRLAELGIGARGEVRHEHDHRHAFEFTLRAEHVLLLPEDRREQFIEAVEMERKLVTQPAR